MLQIPTETVSVAPSTSDGEKNATSPSSAEPLSAPGPSLKSRSCVVCRSRRVRCDKQSPCSNCRRACIACVYPSAGRPPRWARRFERLATNAAASNPPAPQEADQGVDNVMDRLRNLETLVKELRDQLEPAQAATRSADEDSPGTIASDSSVQHHDAQLQVDKSNSISNFDVHKQFGRLVLQDASRSRYVSSGFWSEVNDELNTLMDDTRALAGSEAESLEDGETPEQISSNKELERTAFERNAFLFRHNLNFSTPDLQKLQPLPSQIPFLLDIFSENVNIFVQVVHIPTIAKMVRSMRGNDIKLLTPANEALMFSIYYAAVTSMEEDDIMMNFGSSKTDLNLKYRLGLEYALAKADFLNNPDIVLVQTLAIFLSVVRRNDSPRYVWMMTGMVIRMAQYLGLQRDGTHFKHLTPYDIEMRRKVWWLVCSLDLRSAEDQGTELSIASGSFDTKIPLNINDADIDPESKEMPTERYGITDMSFARVVAEMCNIMRQMMLPGVKDSARSLEDQSRLLDEIYQKCEEGYLQYTTESGNIAYWVAVTIARLIKAKMTLICFLPILFSSPSDSLSDELRTKLLVSAIEVAEYNHSLNAEQACRQWRWMYQTYTHWHAIVYLLIEISRRQWSPIVERAWVALHSRWLIPAQIPANKYLRIWVPLRRLMAKARKHREAELVRLRADPQAAAKLEIEDQNLPLPLSSGPFPAGSSVETFRERWRQLMTTPDETRDSTRIPTMSDERFSDQLNMKFGPGYLGTAGYQVSETMENINTGNIEPSIKLDSPNESTFAQAVESSPYPISTTLPDQPDDHTMGLDFNKFLWDEPNLSNDLFSNVDADSIDVNMDWSGEANWHQWIQSVKVMERDEGPGGNGWT